MAHALVFTFKLTLHGSVAKAQRIFHTWEMLFILSNMAPQRKRDDWGLFFGLDCVLVF